MEFTAGSKTAITTAVGILLAGFAVIIRSASRDNVAGSIGGACIVMVGVSLVILLFVRYWVVNTSEERRVLAAAQRQAQEERTQYIAAKAALENEHGRLNRDMAAERARIRAALKVEQAKMRAEFDEERATLAAEAFRTGVEMERAGMLKPDRQPAGNLIKFPKQVPQPAPARERSREHGVVGP
jgi:hypothetical protein